MKDEILAENRTKSLMYGFRTILREFLSFIQKDEILAENRTKSLMYEFRTILREFLPFMQKDEIFAEYRETADLKSRLFLQREKMKTAPSALLKLSRLLNTEQIGVERGARSCPRAQREREK